MTPEEQTIALEGWVRTKRDSKNVTFFELNDGSCLGSIQVIFDRAGAGAPEGAPASDGESLLSTLDKVQTGAAVAVEGRLVASPGKGQSVELHGAKLTVIGPAPADSYPLQKKRHSFEYLREIAHLRPRTNTFGAVARVRNTLSFAVHRFLNERGFVYVHTPLITSSDAEGAGELFRVTTLPAEEKHADLSGDFFGKPGFLTVSGQLNVVDRWARQHLSPDAEVTSDGLHCFRAIVEICCTGALSPAAARPACRSRHSPGSTLCSVMSKTDSWDLPCDSWEAFGALSCRICLSIQPAIRA